LDRGGLARVALGGMPELGAEALSCWAEVAQACRPAPGSRPMSQGTTQHEEPAPARAVTGVKHRAEAPGAPRYETLTAWRGLACLLVIVFHSLRLPEEELSGWTAWIFEVLGRGWVGVPMFFVISGYCVTASADALRSQPRSGGRFFWRRFRRIYPPYWAVVGLSALGIWLVEAVERAEYAAALEMPGPRTLTGGQWLGNLSLTETWRWRLGGGAESSLLPQAWTLCYEEQFYFLVGMALVLTRRWFFGVLAGLTALVAVQFLFPSPGVNTQGLFLDGKWLMFAAGVWVYYVTRFMPPRRWLWSTLPLVVGMLHAVAGPGQWLRPANQSYFAAFAYALLILGLKPWDDPSSRSALLAPLRFCGERCYSLYLVFWPVAMAVGEAVDGLGATSAEAVLLIRVPCCVAVTILVGHGIHHGIERRFWNPRVRVRA